MDAGATFLVPGVVDPHLWIVLSDPRIDRENVLIVNLTTVTRLKEQACIIERGEHPWVTHRTCVNYQDAKVVSLEKLYRLKDSGHLRLQDPLSATLLQRVRYTAALSVRIAFDKREILVKQGLIDA